MRGIAALCFAPPHLTRPEGGPTWEQYTSPTKFKPSDFGWFQGHFLSSEQRVLALQGHAVQPPVDFHIPNCCGIHPESRDFPLFYQVRIYDHTSDRVDALTRPWMHVEHVQRLASTLCLEHQPVSSGSGCQRPDWMQSQCGGGDAVTLMSFGHNEESRLDFETGQLIVGEDAQSYISRYFPLLSKQVVNLEMVVCVGRMEIQCAGKEADHRPDGSSEVQSDTNEVASEVENGR